MTIATEMALPELPDAVDVDGTEQAWTFDPTAERPAGSLQPLHRAVTVDGRAWLEILADGGRYLLRFPELAEFIVTPAQRRVSCRAAVGVAPSTVRHLLLDQVMPHILSLDGSLVLHASAISTDFGAVALVGPSGAGKSSLAASFAGDGFELLADDFVLLTERDAHFFAVPSYPGLRLWPDSLAVFAGEGAPLAPVSGNSEKQRFVPKPEAARCEPTLLRAIVLLDEGEAERSIELVVRRISARDGFMAVFEQAFRMERSGRERQLVEFDRFARLARSTVLLRVSYHRDFQLLSSVRRGILESIN